MKSVTEFASFALQKGLTTKTALAAEGKTPEEISAAIGESMKLEGDKLKYFIGALEVAAQNVDGLSRVMVVSLAEGENAPAKAVKIEEMHFVPEFKMAPKAVVNKKDLRAATGGKGKGDRKDRPKGSPWGITPEEKAAKKKA